MTWWQFFIWQQTNGCVVLHLVSSVYEFSRWLISHYNDVIMNTMVSQITSFTIIYSTIYSRRGSKKISKLRVTGLCEGNSPVTSEFLAQRGPVMRKMFPFDDVIMSVDGNMGQGMKVLLSFHSKTRQQDRPDPYSLSYDILCVRNQMTAPYYLNGAASWFLTQITQQRIHYHRPTQHFRNHFWLGESHNIFPTFMS